MTKLLFLFCLMLSQPLWAAPLAIVRPTPALQRCHDVLARTQSSVQRYVSQARVVKGSVYLGFYNELSELLRAAGMGPNRAQQMAIAVKEVRDFASQFPTLALVAHLFSEMTERNEVLACVLSERCSHAEQPYNHMLFTGAGGEAIVVLPPSKIHPSYFAINLLGMFSSIAIERFMLSWLQAGYLLESRHPGSADKYYKEFASAYRGEFPPRPGSMDSNFAAAVMQLYSPYISAELFELVEPLKSRENRAHLSAQSFAQFMNDPFAPFSVSTLQRLGVTQENMFHKVAEIIREMEGTVVKAFELDTQ